MRIIFADDHEVVRHGLRFYLERLADDVEIVEAGTFEEAFAKAIDGPPPAMILLDLRLPDIQGMDGLERMRARFPRVPTVVLSGDLSQIRIKEALNRGAAGYLPKTLGGKAMLRALELVMAGETFVPSLALDEGNGTAGDYDPTAPLSSLTPREREVLSHLIEGRANKEIARALDIKEITVKVHLTKLFRKLKATNRTQAVRIALDHGFSA
ncbi:MAG: response regulator transcription factor [Rhodospirillaceae bacterium]|nr:response regulator transcription factor [Rhodospirillaceae bacterium]MBT6119427.1 response regulator transcription factor [Rhodospirillaceae bacterium]